VLIIAERINTSRKRIAEAVRGRDADFIRREAIRQTEAGAGYIDLTMDDSGMPETADDRLRLAETLLKKLTTQGVEADRIYFDPIIRPICTNADQTRAVLDATRRIMSQFEGVHTVCGLSNVSFGLPRRNLLNRSLLALLIGAGLDTVIIDPTEPDMRSTLFAAEALVGRDEFCMRYITAEREGTLEG